MNYTKGKEELRRQFINSVALIKELVDIALTKDYDDPIREEYAKSMAVKLRVLLIDGTSKSLLTQLGLHTKILFHPMCVEFADMPGNLFQTFGLSGAYFDNQKAYFFSNYSKNKTELRCTLACWLDEVVFDRKQNAIHKVSRKDIILNLANKEGGAHVDPSFEKEYFHIAYESGFVIIDQSGNEIRAKNNRYAEALITIAQEFVEAVDEYLTFLSGATFFVCKNDLSLVEVIYDDKNIRKKYMHNQKRNILMCFLFSYDYLNIARYRLIFTSNYLFKKDEKQVFLRVIDDTKYYDVLFCVCGFDTFIFVKNNNKFLRVNKDEDLYKLESLKHYTFSQAIRLIKAHEHSNLDCLTKQRLYLENIENRKDASNQEIHS